MTKCRKVEDGRAVIDLIDPGKLNSRPVLGKAEKAKSIPWKSPKTQEFLHQIPLNMEGGGEP